ncbi:E3 ubiquitin-protein ligase SH3RF3 isoform X3 [Parasteatoda tepidariorum]|uniref:E3 ubiquitin-protein ligase SH3RF3 isoform X3 n=1 Tax=Parasteatoda tepidariorum TaxID=114398 RepID=UPI001C71BCF5|nr:E3 ubiquitin-protein ligase SH3RF3 isoform X3 [Parasteatoda tepidariorum]
MSNFTTMVELGKDTEKCDKSVKCFTMDEAFLNDLLECSVCLEQLDSSSKVLPCQHTFCKRCLHEILNSHKELRCPECRILVDVKIEELPCNILLVRLLEGLKNNVRPKRVGSSTDVALRSAESSSGQQTTPPHPQLPQPLGSLQRSPSVTDLRMVPKQVLQACPCAKALYPYEAKVPGDLTFKKGDVIILRKRVDQNWFYGELGGKSGFVPASFVQVVVPIPSHVPQCKALYDFQISSSEEKDCLTFVKGDILNVIRRIDDHWAEGKLRDRIGIFPISFVEMNAAARAVMKLSANAQSSRILPPVAPSTDSHFVTATTSVENAAQSPQYQDSSSTGNMSQPVSSGISPPFSSTAFTSPIHSSSHTIHQNVSMAGYPGSSYDGQHHASTSSHHRQPQSSSVKASSDEHHVSNDGSHENSAVSKSRSTPSPSTAFSSVASVTPPLRAESIAGAQTPTQGNTDEAQGVSTSLSCSSESSKNSHTPARSTGASQPPTHVPVPTFYLALYTYRPLKEDELELRKGELYTVSEKCQDGWFKGTSLRTGLSGVFPGNYVQIAKSAVLQPHIGVSIAGRTSPASSTSPPPAGTTPLQRTTFSGLTTENPHLFHPISTQGVIYTNSPITLCSRVPATSTSPVSPAHPAVLEWAHSIAVAAPLQRLSRPVSSVASFSPALYKSEIVTDFPVRTTSASPTRMLSYQASPNTSLNQNMVSSNTTSEGLSQARYSTSQPSTPLMMPHSAPPNTNPFVTPDRVSCSTPVTAGAACPQASQATASQNRVEKHKEKKEKEIVSLMKRLTKRKSKSPPPSDYSCDNPSFVDGTSSSQQSLSAVHVSELFECRSTSCPSEALGSQNANHKKTGSLDGSNGEVPKSSSRPKQPAPLVRERFRCIVPYPPNSDYELELKVGDIVYVHKKREDGWYKGTLQRTGKTGLFPSSFVEGF